MVFGSEKKCSSQSTDLSFLCNFKPISSPFLHEQSKVQNFLFWLFFFPLGYRAGMGKPVISISTGGAAKGQSHLCHQCPVLLLDSVLSAPSLIYLIVATQYLG